jgi:hypothetical protein
VPLLARALEQAGIERGPVGGAIVDDRADGRTGAPAGERAPITSALGRLISGELPLDDWVALVRATVPPPARWRRPRPGFWRRAWRWVFGRGR